MNGRDESRARRGERDGASLEALFASRGFAAPEKAAAIWRGIGGGALAPSASRREAVLLGEIASSADPDLALVNLARYVEATASPGAFFGSFVLERPICRLAVTIFSCSVHLSEILARNPGYLAWLIEDPTLGRGKAHSAPT